MVILVKNLMDILKNWQKQEKMSVGIKIIKIKTVL